MSRYAHEEVVDALLKKPAHRMSKKQLSDRMKYLERQQSRERDERVEREIDFPVREDDYTYRP